MATALSPELPPDALSNLIVVDIVPSRASPLSQEFAAYFEGMQKVEDAQVSTRQDAQTILTEYEKVTHWLRPTKILDVNPLPQDPMVRAFLLTNLATAPTSLRGSRSFANTGELARRACGLPASPRGRTWKDGQVVAIKGGRASESCSRLAFCAD